MALIRTYLDWETAYGKHHSGKTLSLHTSTTEEYVRSPLFRAHGLGVKIDNDPTFYLYKRDDLLHFLRNHPWDRTWATAHHAHFDGAILSWRCGIRPKFWGDTLSMFRALYPHEDHSLERMAQVLGLPPKGKELETVKDKWELTDDEQAVLGNYCINDVDLTAAAFNELLKGYPDAPHTFPVSELRIIDWDVRAFTEPVIEVDRAPLIEAFKYEVRTKRKLIKECGATKEMLASNDQFADLLLSLEIDPPKKLSPSKVKDGRVNPDDYDSDDAPQGKLPTFKAPKGATKEEKEQLKAEKTLYPWAYAFGKDDERFKMLLDHPDEKIAAIIEARIGIKSTIKGTRSKRFWKIGSRGAFPVYLLYYGAHSGRFSGGGGVNPQNLNRVDPDKPHSGALRYSWIAPAGHKMIVRDLGQIEARMLAYVAGQDDMVQMFRDGGDPYNFMASKIYGVPIDRKNNPDHAKPGQVGKMVVLGCFGPDTKVITNSGVKRIVDVTASDMVWDGVEFVTHAGVVPQGEKECLTAHGVSATPDHEILTEHGWAEWSAVLTNPSLFQSAVSLASLPSCDGREKTEDTTQSCVVRAGGRGWSSAVTFLREGLRGVTHALRKRLLGLLPRSIGGMLTSYRTQRTELDYSIASHPALVDAIMKIAERMRPMAGGVFMSMSRGGAGLSAGERSYRIWSPLTGGSVPRSNSIASTITKAMSQGTFGSLGGARIPSTDAPSPTYSRKLMTYDIAYAGPRHRFTVMTDSGPILVHNCGYSMGWSKFQEGARIGFMGMSSILFDQTYVDMLGVDVMMFCNQRSYKPGCATLYDEAMKCKPLNVSEQDHLMHCAVAKHLIDTFRRENPAVVRLWNACRDALRMALAGIDTSVGVHVNLPVTNKSFWFPNGMAIRYNGLRESTTKKGEIKYLANRQRKEWTRIYGGKCVENLIQGLSRIVLTDQQARIEDRIRQLPLNPGEVLKIASSTHDELIAVAPDRHVEDVFRIMGEEMARPSSWCPDLPLKSSGGWAQSYGECEK